MAFNGFTQKSLDFLFENRMHNSKTWFEEHRKEYEELVLNPLRELVVALTPQMLQIDPQFTVEPKVNKTIARIYRDTRFSKDKSLFRDELWITFMRNKRFWEGLPGYYFLFSPAGFLYGFGYYEASTESMESLRTMVLNRDKAFLSALKAYENQKIFKITGQKYKRTKYPAEPENMREWLDLKNISFDCKSADFNMLFSPSLVNLLADGFETLKPLYDFICTVEQRKKQ